MDTENSSMSVTWKQIGIVSLSFVLGILAAMFFANTQLPSETNFTTVELIGFTLSVILSGASIVLAISAIALGRASEKAVIDRSDESIRLQNEVFVKTTEALQRIESSTGVTEKRIEDMISGRVGDISHQVAEMATKGAKTWPADRKELEESIRKSILNSIRTDQSEAEILEMQRRRQEVEEEEKKYQEKHEELLLSIGNIDGVEIEKLGHGNPGLKDENAFDGVFKTKDKRIAVSTLRPEPNPDLVRAFIPVFARNLSNGLVDTVYIVFFGDEKTAKPARDYLQDIKPDIAGKMKLIVSTYDQLDEIRDEISSDLT